MKMERVSVKYVPFEANKRSYHFILDYTGITRATKKGYRLNL